MKNKKLDKTLKQAKDAAEQANKALSAMEELGEDELDEIAGAGNPLGNVPRIPTQPIDDDLRGNG